MEPTTNTNTEQPIQSEPVIEQPSVTTPIIEENIPTEHTTPVISKTDAIVADMHLNKEWLITLLLAFFLGLLGVHRFYNGKIWTGILMILTFGGFGVWATIDTIMIIFGKFTTKDGSYIPVQIPVK